MKYAKVLVSYPKSGRNWLWYSVRLVIFLEYKVPFGERDEMFAEAGLPLASSTHSFRGQSDPKLNADLFFLYRNPLDTLASLSHWREKFKLMQETESLGTFISSWAAKGLPEITYEDLHFDYVNALTKFLSWLGVTASENSILYAQEKSSIDADLPYEARSGKVGEGKVHFCPGEQERIWKTLRKYQCNVWDKYR